MSMHLDPEDPVKVQLTLMLKPSLLNRVDQIKQEWGLHSRAAVIERLLVEVLAPAE